MKTGYIAITELCTRRCLACPCGARKSAKHLSTQEVERAVETAFADGGLDLLTISGGEPTLHPEIFEILRYLESKPIRRVGFLTTGERFCQPEFLKKVLEIMPAERLSATVALHSFDAQKHDDFVGRVGSWRESYDALQAASRAGIGCSLKYIVTRQTYRDFEEYVREYYARFSSDVALTICNLDFCGVGDELRDRLKVAFAQMRPILEAALDYVEARAKEGDRRAVRVFDTPFCAIDPYYWQYLLSQAKVAQTVYSAPTLTEPKRNLASDSAPFFAPCKRCAVAEWCPGTWRTAGEVWGDDAFKPFKNVDGVLKQ